MINLNDDELNLQIKLNEVKLVGLYAEYKKLSNKIAALSKSQKLLEKEQATRQVAAAGDEIPWGILLEFTQREATYELLRDALKRISPDGAISQAGYLPETNQYSIQLRLTKDTADKLEAIEHQLSALLMYIRPFYTTGERFLDLAEPSLSEDGNFSLREKDGGWEIRKMYYHRESLVKKLSSTRDMLEYVQEHYCNH
jgi:hypothetical protein